MNVIWFADLMAKRFALGRRAMSAVTRSNEPHGRSVCAVAPSPYHGVIRLAELTGKRALNDEDLA